MKHAMPQLPYTMEALAPLMSQETWQAPANLRGQPEQTDSRNALRGHESGRHYLQSRRRHFQQCRTNLEPYILFRNTDRTTSRHTCLGGR